MDCKTLEQQDKITTSAALARITGQSQRPESRLRALADTLFLWKQRFVERRQMRRDLDAMTPEMLCDFGLTRRSAEKLANRPFWRGD